jgi:hypothetical protein
MQLQKTLPQRSTEMRPRFAESQKKDVPDLCRNRLTACCQITEDGARTGVKSRRLPEFPDMSYVSRIITSNH